MKRIKLVEDFEEAVRAHAWKGSYSENPHHVAQIEKEYELTKLKLVNEIEKLKKQSQDWFDEVKRLHKDIGLSS